MRKIGGVNMGAISTKFTKEKTTQRYCSVYESLEESLKEVKLHREGKTELKTWDELYKELQEDKE